MLLIEYAVGEESEMMIVQDSYESVIQKFKDLPESWFDCLFELTNEEGRKCAIRADKIVTFYECSPRDDEDEDWDDDEDEDE